MKKFVLLTSLLFATLCVSSQNITMSERLLIKKQDFSSISDWALFVQDFYKLEDLQKRMHDAVLKISNNNKKAKDRAVFLSNDAGYTAILYKGNFFFIRVYNCDRITEVIESELQHNVNLYENKKMVVKKDWEEEDDLVADYKQKLKQDKAIDPVNGGHRHEIEKALDLHQRRLILRTEELEEATKKFEEIEKECALLYKELDIIIGKYYSIRDKREDNKGFACII